MRTYWQIPRPDPRRTLVVACGLVLSLVSWLAFRPWDLADWMIGAPFGRDYVNFWLAPRLVLAGQGDRLVDLAAYGHTVMAAFGLTTDPNLVFVYPPHALLFMAPLALLPFVPALCLWTAANLAALAATVRLCGVPDGSAPSRAALMGLVCLSPAAVAMVTYGHFGGFLALASTLAVVESERRPWLTGLCLACLTIKPQYAFLLGLILLCGGRWRWLPSAAAGTLALVGLSAAAFGVETWVRFVGVTMPFQSAIITAFKAGWIMTSVTPYFTARFWGMPGAAAWALQAVVAVLAVAGAARALRRRPDPAALTLVLLAAILSQPYASHYDLAALAPALTCLVFDERGAGRPLLALLALLAWLTVPLAALLVFSGLPVLSIVLVALLARLASDGLRLRADRPAPGAAPRTDPRTEPRGAPLSPEASGLPC